MLATLLKALHFPEEGDLIPGYRSDRTVERDLSGELRPGRVEGGQSQRRGLRGPWRPPPSLASQMGKDQGYRSEATVWALNAPEAKKKRKILPIPQLSVFLPLSFCSSEVSLRGLGGPVRPSVCNLPVVVRLALMTFLKARPNPWVRVSPCL